MKKDQVAEKHIFSSGQQLESIQWCPLLSRTIQHQIQTGDQIVHKPDN